MFWEMVDNLSIMSSLFKTNVFDWLITISESDSGWSASIYTLNNLLDVLCNSSGIWVLSNMMGFKTLFLKQMLFQLPKHDWVMIPIQSNYTIR